MKKLTVQEFAKLQQGDCAKDRRRYDEIVFKVAAKLYRDYKGDERHNILYGEFQPVEVEGFFGRAEDTLSGFNRTLFLQQINAMMACMKLCDTRNVEYKVECVLVRTVRKSVFYDTSK